MGTKMGRKKRKTIKKDEGTPVEPYGHMYPSVEKNGPMFFRETVGKATAQDGTVYELDVNVSGLIPIVTSTKTGKRFTLTWEDIIGMAQKAGIDNE